MRSDDAVAGRTGLTRINPNVAVASAAVAIAAVEAATRSQARYGPEIFVAGLALLLAWSRREELDPRAVVAIAVALPATLAVIHLVRGVAGDIDVQSVYPTEGRSLLDGTYPHSEYPPGAVALFAAEEWVDRARNINPFVMAVAEGAIAWALCALRGTQARWSAAFVAVWPTSAFFWEFKFDALPTALLVLGLAASLRNRWQLAGALLGAGAAVKWSPAVAALLLLVWLFARQRRRDALRHAAGFSVAFIAIVGPFALWSPAAVWASVTRQAPRSITPESMWYLPLRLFGQARAPGAVYDAAAVPSWANFAAVVVQSAVIVLLLVLLVTRGAVDLQGAVALAALGPAAFLVLNKVFSAQYELTVLASVSVGATLVGRARGAVLLLAVAASANVLVYPIGRFWQPASAILFVSALAAIVWVAGGALRGRARCEDATTPLEA